MQNSIYFDDASLRFHEIFHCFMVLCFDFEDVNSFFMGISRRAYYYMHQFFQARFYCFESLRVLGRREELTMWPRHKKIETSSQPLVNIAYCLSALLHDFIFSTKPVPIQKREVREIFEQFLPCQFSLAHPALLIRPLQITIQFQIIKRPIKGLANLALPNRSLTML